MVTWHGIQSWKESSLDIVLDELIFARKNAIIASESIQDINSNVIWSGEGKKAADGTLSKIESKASELLTYFGDLITATSTAQAGMKNVETLVLEANTIALKYGFIINDSHAGIIVNDPIPLEMDPITAIDRTDAQHRCANAAAQALTKADEIDKSYVSSLNKVAEGKVENVESLDDLTPGLPDMPRDGATPKEVAAWWDALTDDEKKNYVSSLTSEDAQKNTDKLNQARKFGNLNGIDGWARDNVNRSILDHDLKEIQKEIDYEAEKLKEKSIPQMEAGRFNELVAKRAELEKLKNAAANTDSNISKQLLLYDPATGQPGHENLHAAIALGNVDNAEDIATFTFGMGTTVDGSVEGCMESMENLHNRAQANGKNVASIMWMGYDAPPTPWSSGDLSVTSTDKAVMGGDKLASFVEGIQASRDTSVKGTSPIHQSVIGHSYGSTTASYAMTKVQPGVVDDFIMYGSPGYMGDSVKDFAVPPGHTYAMRYDNDIIQHFTGNLGPDPMKDSNIIKLDPGKTGMPFSANLLRFNSITSPMLGQPQGFMTALPPAAIAEVYGEGKAHVAYLDDGSQAQREIIKVITGQNK